jgi:hypothetical protein
MPVLKNYTQFTGLDLKVSHLREDSLSARDSLNTDISDKGSLIKRKGISSAATSVTDVLGVGVWINSDGEEIPVYIKQDGLYVGNDPFPTSFSLAINTIANPFANSHTNTLGDKQGASFATLNGNLYIATGYDPLMKYDGVRLSKAGAPNTIPSSITTTSTSGDWTATSSVRYYSTYTIEDENQIISSSALSSYRELTGAKPATTRYELTFPTLAPTDGWAIKSSALLANITVGATSIVIAESTWSVGDTIYISGTPGDLAPQLVERYVLIAKTATNTFTLDRPAESAATSGIYVSNGYISIIRQIDQGSLILAAEYPLRTGVSTETYFDSDGTATAPNFGIFNLPVNKGLAPKASYVSVHRNQLVLADILEDNVDNSKRLDTVFYSDIADQEAFNVNNSFIPSRQNGVAVTGISTFRDNLYTFTKNDIFVISGDLETSLSFRVDRVPYSNMGCISHQSIQNTEAGLFFLSQRGVYRIVAPSSKPEWVGEPISPLTTGTVDLTTQGYANGAYLNRESKYIISLTDSHAYVFDIKSNTWHKWDVLKSSQLVTANSETIIMVNDTASAVDKYLQEDTDATRIDFGSDAINMFYTTAWDSFGAASKFKKFLRAKIFTGLDDTFGAFTLTVNTYFDYNSSSTASIDFAMNDNASYPSETKSKLPSRKAKSVSWKISNNTVSKRTDISGVEVEAEFPYAERVKE